MSEQRYSDDEVRKIFDLAASTGPAETEETSASPERSTDEGFTLAELQDIGREAGLEPDRIAKAAAALRGRPGAGVRAAVSMPRQTAWGMPVAVGRMVELPRAPTDREWEMLVAELRNTFQARGRARSDGGLREWVNGNLTAAVEPSQTGYRLRMSTLKGDAMLLNVAGVGSLAMALWTAMRGGSGPIGTDADASAVMMFALIGIVALVVNYVRMPRWANTREGQMEYIADRLAAIMKSAALQEGPRARGPSRPGAERSEE
jgi:hypothetical protein